ncbi:MAG: hypothetical protein U1F67_19835 [Rubrivivax sp.]
MRKFGQFTIPDFLGAPLRGLNLARFIGILAAILCSFTYVVAQIYGVGIITTRLSGLAFEIGIFVGLGGSCVRSWAACAPSPGPRWRSTSFSSSPTWCRWFGCRSSGRTCRCRRSSTACSCRR